MPEDWQAQDSSYTLDDVDRQIVEYLRGSGRASNQQIARELGLTAATVSTRLRRMEDEGVMRVVAVADFRAFGLDVMIVAGINVKGRPASEVAQDLAQLDEVMSIHLTTGRYDLEALIMLHNQSELAGLLRDRIGKVKGIRDIAPAIAVDVPKYEFFRAPIS